MRNGNQQSTTTHHLQPTTMRHFILLVALWSVLSCKPDQSPVSERATRAEAADKSQREIVIGIVATTEKGRNFFLEGAKLAIADLNQKDGVLGRNIIPIVYDDEKSLEKGLQISEQVAGNLDIVAVVGHLYSHIAIPASVTYEKNGILFLSPGATDPSLTKYGGVFTFRNILSGEEFGRQLAEFASYRNMEKIVVLYDREDTEARRLAEIFNDEAVKREIRIVTQKSYYAGQEDLPLLISDITQKYQFDALFLSGGLPTGANVIMQLRNMGMTLPILGGNHLDSTRLGVIAGKSADGTIVPTLFDPRRSDSRSQAFIKHFILKYGVLPDTWAAQGYDAIQVLAHAMRKSNSTVPISISTTLRSLRNWRGITGRYAFTRDGDIIGKTVFFKEMRSGDFEFLPYKKEAKDQLDLVESITMRLPMEGILTTIDPGLAKAPASVEVVEQLFLGLTDLDPETYQAVPELAEKPAEDVRGDAKIWRFQMRRNAVWTDGTPVTAHDVVWAIHRNLDPKTKSPHVEMLHLLKNAKAIHNPDALASDQGGGDPGTTDLGPEEEKSDGGTEDAPRLGVVAIDDFTVEFSLEHPTSHFPVLAGFPVFRPLPQKLIEKHKETWTDPENIQTNGSYKMAIWEKDRLLILEKSPSYYDAKKVSIQEIRYYMIQKSSVGLAMYETNELDIMGGSHLPIPLVNLPRIKMDPTLKLEYVRAPKPCTYAYAFNTRLPPVDQSLVRKAISAAVNRELLIKTVTRGDEKPARTFTPPPVFGSVDSGNDVGMGFEPIQARKWLAEAGYPDGEGFPEITLLCDKSEPHARIARAVQTFLKHYLNMNVKLDESENYARALDQPPHMFQYEQCKECPDATCWLHELFHPYFSPNKIGWKNLPFAQFTDSARETSDTEERRKLCQRAEQTLVQQEAAVVPIFFETQPCMVKPRVEGWHHMAIGGQHIRNWRIIKEW